MKFIFLLLSLQCKAFLASSQSLNYHAFKVDVMAGVDPGNYGGSISVQPHYRLSDALAVGIRLDEVYFVTLATRENTIGGVNLNGVFSVCPGIEYYVSNHGFRPFIGAGAGLFYPQGATAQSPPNSDFSTSVNSGAKFGFYPEVGFETGHFRLAADYDVLSQGGSIFLIRAGIFFGGGRKH